MSELAGLIADEIRREGPIPFSRFMHLALYNDPGGYYRTTRDPFGKHGDFYTAEQIQPVFGRLMAAYIRKLAGPGCKVVELGAGRREMADAFGEFDYTPVDVSYGSLPEQLDGVVFSNEYFDAIPVDLVVARDGETRQRRVGYDGSRFVWDDSLPAVETLPEDIEILETQAHRTAALTRISERLHAGYIVTIDYGYTRRELVRFPQGTLMSYYRHRALDDVLVRPGEQDITAHVDFTALQEHGALLGLQTIRFESLASALLWAGEDDNFASALAGDEATGRLQLKSLLFGMGEVFRVLVQRR